MQREEHGSESGTGRDATGATRRLAERLDPQGANGLAALLQAALTPENPRASDLASLLESVADIGNKPVDVADLAKRILAFAAGREADEAALLRENQSLWSFRTAVEQSANAIVITDANARIEYVNPAFERCSGYTAAEAVGRNPKFLKSGRQTGAFYGSMWAELTAGRPWTGLFHNRHKNGSLYWEFATISPMLDAGGRTVKYIAVKENVTARMEAEEKLRIAHDQLRIVLDADPNYIFVKDYEGKFLLANKAMADLFRLPPDEVVGKTDSAYGATPEQIESYHSADVRVIQSGKPLFIPEEHVLRPDGSLGWFQTTKIPISMPGEDRPCVLGVSIDITDRKKAEEQSRRIQQRLTATLAELHSSEKLLKQTGEAAGVGGWEYSVATGELRWTEENYRIHELPPDYVPTMEKSFGFFPGEAKETARSAFRCAIETGSSYDLELPFFTASGRPIFVRAVGLVEEENGHAVRIFGTLQDITERRLATSALEEKNAFLNSLLSAIPSPTYYKDTEGRFLGINQAFEDFFGVGKDDILGRTVKLLFPPEMAVPILERDRDLIENPGQQVYEARVIDKYGLVREVIMQKATFADRDGRVAGIIGTNIDITDRKRTEEALQATNLQLADAHRQALELSVRAEAAKRAKSDFLANMSHEIRTPLNAIIGMSELLELDPASPETQEYIETIRSSGDALLALVNDILDFSKVEAGQLELERIPVDLDDCVNSALRMVAGVADRKGLFIDYQSDPALPPAILGDVTRLRQILLNLLSNAVKFTEKGGIRLRLHCIEPKDGPPLLRFSVADTGIGIPREYSEKIFQSFSQVDNSMTRRFGGTGLGLAICKKIVTLMEGRIWVESQPGMGSTFSFEIPLHAATRPSLLPPESTSLPSTPAPEEILGTRCPMRILIAEDNPTNLRLVDLMLKRFGYVADSVSNGLEALQALEENSYDLVLMDVQMPVMDGLEAARAIRARYRNPARPHIVALTANALEGDRELCIEAGMDSYLCKPLRSAQLASAIEEIYALRNSPL